MKRLLFSIAAVVSLFSAGCCCDWCHMGGCGRGCCGSPCASPCASPCGSPCGTGACGPTGYAAPITGTAYAAPVGGAPLAANFNSPVLQTAATMPIESLPTY